MLPTWYDLENILLSKNIKLRKGIFVSKLYHRLLPEHRV